MILFEILTIIVLILVNGMLAMFEIAIVSSRKSRLEYLAREGSKGAVKALRLIDDPSRFFATVQVGITLVGIIAGAFGGATLGQRLGDWLNTFQTISPHGNAFGIGTTVLVITYLSLILGEIVPKRIALAEPERIASIAAGPMIGLSVTSRPIVWILHVSTESVLRLLGLSRSRETTVTEDEVKSLIAEGTVAGVFVPQEKDMIEGVLRLADRPVGVIMTPRSKIIWVDVKSGPDTIVQVTESYRFSRLLVCKGTVDHPIGFVQTKDLLPAALRKLDFELATMITPLFFVPDSMPVLRLLNRFKKEKLHIAVVVNEHGTVEGLVTLTDVIEAIAGDLPERGEDSDTHIVRRADGSWLVDGTVPTDEVEIVTGIHFGKEVMVIAGFVLAQLGRIPQTSESFRYGNARFEIVDMDRNRIDKILIEIDQTTSDSINNTE